MSKLVTMLPAWTAFLCLAIFTAGCDEGNVVAPQAHRPYTPSEPNPNDGAKLARTTATLRWESGDPDGDTLFYDIYLGTTRRPSLRNEDCLSSELTVAFLEGGQTYYWRVVARDPGGNSSQSPLWTFSTEKVSPNLAYPYAVGNRWEYAGAYYFRNADKNTSIVTGISMDTTATSVVTEIVGYDTLAGSLLAGYRTETDYSKDSAGLSLTAAEVAWYNDFGDGRYKIADDEQYSLSLGSLGWILDLLGLDLPLGTGIGSTGEPLATIDEEAYLLDPPHRDLAYPLKVGLSWTYSTWPSQEWPQTQKIVTGRKTVTVPAGSFECWEIRWRYIVHEDGSYYTSITHVDYVADIGLVASYYLVEDLTWVDYDNRPDDSGTVDLVEYLELVDYDLK